MRFREIISEQQTGDISAKIATSDEVWDYVQSIHPPEEATPFLKDLVLKFPRYELRDIPLTKLKIPLPYYPDDDEESEEEPDPYGRTLWVDYDYAGEVSAHNVDRLPIVVDPNGNIIDGNHRAWAAAELLNKNSIRAWVATSREQK